MFDIWFCPIVPLDAITVSKKVYKEGSEIWRLALAKNISEHGLVNPLLVLNHRGPKYKGNWLKTGTNRIWALRHLGWKTAPCLVTGTCDYWPATKVTLEEAQSHIKDGRLIVIEEAHGWILHLENVCLPEDYVYPSDTQVRGQQEHR